LEVCNSSIDDCLLDINETSIFTKSSSINYETFIEDDKIFFADSNDNNLFSIDSSGNIEKFTNIDFSLNNDNIQDYLLIDVVIA
jgi:hypothetical protein